MSSDRRLHTSGKKNNLCRYCKKAEYKPGHRCQEYWDSKKPVLANRAARADIMEDIQDILLPVNMEKLDIHAQGRHLKHTTNNNTNSTFVPILVQNSKQWGLVDTGANKSFVTPELVQSLKLTINDTNKHKIYLASKSNHSTSLGTTNISLSYMGRELQHEFNVMDLSLSTQISIGSDLMPKLGIALTGLATSWHTYSKIPKEETPTSMSEPNNSPAGTEEERKQFMQAIRSVPRRKRANSKKFPLHRA